MNGESAFWQRVRKTAQCWEWFGPLTPVGYGTHGAKRVHRLSWEMANGPIPDGLHVLHKCDNRKCVRPDHLFIGTHQDNLADAGRKGRMRMKLSIADIRRVRARYASGQWLQRELAVEFGVKRGTISRIVNRVRRFYVDETA